MAKRSRKPRAAKPDAFSNEPVSTTETQHNNNGTCSACGTPIQEGVCNTCRSTVG